MIVWNYTDHNSCLSLYALFFFGTCLYGYPDEMVLEITSSESRTKRKGRGGEG